MTGFADRWSAGIGLPNRYSWPIEGDSLRQSIWNDQPNMEGWLGEAWSARRTDNWNFFKKQLARSSEPIDELTPLNMLTMHSLNHLLIYSGPGWHPLLSLDQLVHRDSALVGGFTKEFKAAFRDFFPALRTFWAQSSYAPHRVTDCDLNVVQGASTGVNTERTSAGYLDSWKDGDMYHLSTHCSVPLGYLWADNDLPAPRFSMESTCAADVSMPRGLPGRVFSVEGPNYSHWMRHLRNLDTGTDLAIVRYDVRNSDFEQEFTLGFFLLDSRQNSMTASPNRVGFVRDAELPIIVNQIVGWVD